MNLLKWRNLRKSSAAAWEAFAVEDNRVITGQNPASGGPVAELVLQHLKEHVIKKQIFHYYRKICFLRNHCKIAITSFQFPNHQLLLYTPV